jgi:hypothetical protein
MESRVPVYYEAAWTDSWAYCQCFHSHQTIMDAARCGPKQRGFYLVAVEAGVSRELTADEDKIVDAVRFDKLADSANG